MNEENRKIREDFKSELEIDRIRVEIELAKNQTRLAQFGILAIIGSAVTFIINYITPFLSGGGQ